MVEQFLEMGVLHDYSIGGHELEGINPFDFILNTYEATQNRCNSTNSVFMHYLPGTGKQNKGQVVQPSRQEMVPEMFGGQLVAGHLHYVRATMEGCMRLL